MDMDNNLSFLQIFAYLKRLCQSFCASVADYAEGLSSHELVAVVFFVALLFLVMFCIVWAAIKNGINKRIMKKRNERKALFWSDNRLDRKNVQTEGAAEVEDENLGATENDNFSSFDWSPLSKQENVRNFDVAEENLQYRLKPHKLADLLGLIVDLLSRDVEEAKLAQVIMHKNQHLDSEDDIIYTIAAIKMFVKMAKTGAFKKIDSNKILPNEIVAIFNLTNGDCSLVLVLIEAYIDDAIDKLKKIEGRDKQKKCSEIADVCVCFGTLALFADVSLAAGAFELAIELNPRNSIAWGRLGDAYRRAQSVDKAVWAYMNVLNLGDSRVYTQQIANAEKMLSFYYRENGKKNQANNMLENSRQFYEKIGINAPLTERESRIVYIIETNERDNMENVVEKLFSLK